MDWFFAIFIEIYSEILILTKLHTGRGCRFAGMPATHTAGNSLVKIECKHAGVTLRTC